MKSDITNFDQFMGMTKEEIMGELEHVSLLYSTHDIFRKSMENVIKRLEKENDSLKDENKILKIKLYNLSKQ